MVSDKSLKRLYNRLNLAYFNGQLPEVVIWYEPCHDAFGITLEIEEPESGERELGIKIDPQIAFSWKLTKSQVLHEMCHVKLWNGRAIAHGNAFWAEMDRLWQIGAFRKEGCL